MTDNLENLFREQTNEIPDQDFSGRIARLIRAERRLRIAVLSIASLAGATGAAFGWLVGGEALASLTTSLITTDVDLSGLAASESPEFSAALLLMLGAAALSLGSAAALLAPSD